MVIREQDFYSKLLIILIFSQIFGLIGAPFFISRVLALVFLPFCFLSSSVFFKTILRNLVVLWIVFLVSALIFMIVPYIDLKINHLIYMGINMIVFCEIIIFSFKVKDIHKTIWKGWYYFILFSLPIALVELVFNYHLPISFFDAEYFEGSGVIMKKFSSVTFGNYNQYMVLLCFGETFILSGLLRSNLWFKKQRKKIFIISAVVFLVVVINASRGALLYLLLCYSVVLYYLRKENYKNLMMGLKSSLVTFFVIIIFISLIIQTNIFDNILNRLITVGYSDDSRRILRESGIEMFIDSYFIGVGPGNFLENIGSYSNSIKMPAHNFFVELLSEYGLLLFLTIFVLKIDILVRFYKQGDFLSKFFLYSFIISMFIVFTINSTYTHGVYIWFYLGSISALAIVGKKNINYE